MMSTYSLNCFCISYSLSGKSLSFAALGSLKHLGWWGQVCPSENLIFQWKFISFACNAFIIEWEEVRQDSFLLGGWLWWEFRGNFSWLQGSLHPGVWIFLFFQWCSWQYWLFTNWVLNIIVFTFPWVLSLVRYALLLSTLSFSLVLSKHSLFSQSVLDKPFHFLSTAHLSFFGKSHSLVMYLPT